MWSVVNLGKWREKGLTLPQIILRDPDWFFWAFDKGVFPEHLSSEASALHGRASGIKIKKLTPDEWRIEYSIGLDGKFAGFEVIPKNRPRHEGSTRCIRRSCLDMGFPRSLQTYDKLGCRLMLTSMRFYWFRTSSRLTKAICEDFFDNPANFV
jgi:hypothetical protein